MNYETAELMRNDYFSGKYAQTELCVKYGVSRHVVSKVVNCEIWASPIRKQAISKALGSEPDRDRMVIENGFSKSSEKWYFALTCQIVVKVYNIGTLLRRVRK